MLEYMYINIYILQKQNKKQKKGWIGTKKQSRHIYSNKYTSSACLVYASILIYILVNKNGNWNNVAVKLGQGVILLICPQAVQLALSSDKSLSKLFLKISSDSPWVPSLSAPDLS